MEYDVTSLSPEQMELLAELEHIRWCRYHQFHNWRMGIPKNGARKDATLRIHKDLIPYDELTEEEKEKDKDNIRMLLKLFAESKKNRITFLRRNTTPKWCFLCNKYIEKCSQHILFLFLQKSCIILVR